VAEQKGGIALGGGAQAGVLFELAGGESEGIA
jgi:hypothetical protein